jgi:Protein of unknown function (DUF1761)
MIAVVAATVAAFVAGGAYYSVVPTTGGETPPWTLAIEVLRCAILAAVVTGIASRGDIDTWTGGLLLGLVLWTGFPFVLWLGAVVHENTPVKLAAVHGGDWLLKLVLIGPIVAVL